MGKLSGKASYLTLGGTRVEITKWSPKVTRDLADTTDSANYDAASDMIQPSQLPVKVATELSIEGFYYVTSTTSAFASVAFSGAAAAAVVLYFTSSQIYGHGNFDLSDFEADVPIDDTVTFKATLKSNGVFVVGS